MATIMQTRKEQEKQEKRNQFPLQPGTYKFILIGLAVVIVRFVLMMGGGADSPTEFNYDIFSFQRITLAPIVVLIGFGVIGWAIIRKIKK